MMDYGEANIQEGDSATVTVGDDRTITVSEGRRPHRSILHAHGHAEEDLPFLSSLDEEYGDLSEEFHKLTLVPRHVSIALRIKDVAFNTLAAAWGELEQARLPDELMQRFVAKLPRHSYTFEVDPGVLSRGSRPDSGKLKNLAAKGGFGTTVNLCKEMVDGDTPLIRTAGLSSQMQTAHIPITDNTQPEDDQVLHFLDLVSSKNRKSPVYVHCEAGVGRTGVMVACYRMAVMGWDPANAILEAEHFGCATPAQQAFIADFGDKLQHPDRTPLRSHVHAENYPLERVGSAASQDTKLHLKDLKVDEFAETA